MANNKGPKPAAPAKSPAEIEAAKKERRAKFERLASARTSKAIVALRNIRKLANKRAYEFSEADVAKIEKAVTSEMEMTADAFEHALKGSTSGGTVFSL